MFCYVSICSVLWQGFKDTGQVNPVFLRQGYYIVTYLFHILQLSLYHHYCVVCYNLMSCSLCTVVYVANVLFIMNFHWLHHFPLHKTSQQRGLSFSNRIDRKSKVGLFVIKLSKQSLSLISPLLKHWVSMCLIQIVTATLRLYNGTILTCLWILVWVKHMQQPHIQYSVSKFIQLVVC